MVPQFSEQKLVCEDFAGVPHEHAQKLVLFGGKFHLVVAHFDNASYEVNRQFAGTKDRALAVNLELVAKCRAHSGKEFVHPEWLGHIIVGSEIERLNLSGLITSAGQHHDWNAL